MPKNDFSRRGLLVFLGFILLLWGGAISQTLLDSFGEPQLVTFDTAEHEYANSAIYTH